MTLVRYEPWTLMNRLHRELDDLFRAPLAQPAEAATASGEERPVALIPSVDVHEEADRYVVRADLPGALLLGTALGAVNFCGFDPSGRSVTLPLMPGSTSQTALPASSTRRSMRARQHADALTKTNPKGRRP